MHQHLRRVAYLFVALCLLSGSWVIAEQVGEPDFTQLASAAPETAPSAAPTVEELAARLDAMEKEHDKEINELKATMGGFVQPGHNKASMNLSGRVQLDYWGFPETSPGIDAMERGPDGPQDQFQFRRVRFGVAGDLPSNMQYKIEMEFAGGNSTEFRDAYLGWNDLPWLQTVLIGNQKRPYGLDAINSSRYNVFMERPFIVEAFNQDVRRLGIASYGYSEEEAWNWRYGVYNLRNTQDEGIFSSDHLQLEATGRMANTFWYDECSDGRGYGHWAVAGSLAYPDGSNLIDHAGPGPDAGEARFQTRPEARAASRWLDTGFIEGADRYQLLALEGVLNLGAVQFVTEYQNIWLQRDAGFGNEVHLSGAYAYVSYFLTGEHMPWDRQTGQLGRPKPFEDFFLVNTCDGSVGRGWGAWQVAFRASYADLNEENIYGGIGESYTLGLNWYWTAYARMQFNYLHGRIRDRDVSLLPNNLDLQTGSYDIVGVRFMVDF